MVPYDTSNTDVVARGLMLKCQFPEVVAAVKVQYNLKICCDANGDEEKKDMLECNAGMNIKSFFFSSIFKNILVWFMAEVFRPHPL